LKNFNCPAGHKTIDPAYRGEYDLCLPYASGNIKIEVKASRAVDDNECQYKSKALWLKAELYGRQL
jgi:hypothetical protein